MNFYRFGRKFKMIIGSVLAAITFTLQSLSINYPMFLVLEIVSSTVFSGVYSATFVLGKSNLVICIRVIFTYRYIIFYFIYKLLHEPNTVPTKKITTVIV